MYALHIYCIWTVEILSNHVPLYLSFHPCVQSHHAGSWKLATVKIFTPWKWTKSTNLYFFYCFGNYLTLILDAFVLSCFSCFCLFVTPRTVARLAPLSMGFPRQEYWRELPFPFTGDLPNQRTEPRSPSWLADFLPSEPPGKLCKITDSTQI